jgi:hypothetical protein
LANDLLRAHEDSPTPAKGLVEEDTPRRFHMPAGYRDYYGLGPVQLKASTGQEGDAYERQADAVADRVVRGESAEPLLDAVGPAAPAVQLKPNSTPAAAPGGNTLTINTDDATYVIDGHAATSPGDVVAAGPGPIRYVRTDGLADCAFFAYQGTRLTDGRTATLVAHLSTKSYEFGAQGGRALDFVRKFKESVNHLQALAVTNYDHDYNVEDKLKGNLRKGNVSPPVHNAQFRPEEKDPGPYASFIADTVEFDIHAIGAKTSGDDQVLESVQTYLREPARVAERLRRQKECCNIL